MSVIETPMTDEEMEFHGIGPLGRFEDKPYEQYLEDKVNNAGGNAIFTASAPDVMDQPKVDTFLYRILFTVLGMYGMKWVTQYQKYGTCGGQTGKECTDIVHATDVLMYGHEFMGRASVAGTYAGSRQISNQLGRWEGTGGPWLADFLQHWGVLFLKDIGLPEDSQDPDENFAVKWAQSGIPKQYIDLMKSRPIVIKDCPRMTTPEAIGAGVQNGVPTMFGTKYVPVGTRNKEGAADSIQLLPRNGGHEMTYHAVRWDSGGQVYALLCGNHWSSNWPSGGGLYLDQPAGSIWVYRQHVLKMMTSGGDAYGVSGVNGLRPKTLPTIKPLTYTWPDQRIV